MWHVTIIHGIHQGLTRADWTHRFGNHLELRLPRVAIETESYQATAIAPWNLWVTNPIYARAHAARVQAFAADYDRASAADSGVFVGGRSERPRGVRTAIVAHSNGCDIAVKMARRLAALGISTESMILTGAAAESDVEKSGLADLVRTRWIGRVIAYCSEVDRVIGWTGRMPGLYGGLGVQGWQRDGGPYGLRVRGYDAIDNGEEWGRDRHRFVTRWFPDFSHGEWFSPGHREETFRCFAEDLGIEMRD